MPSWIKKNWFIWLGFALLIGYVAIGTALEEPDPERIEQIRQERAEREAAEKARERALALVQDLIGGNDYDLDRWDLSVMDNPVGRGHFVYVPRDADIRTAGHVFWIVIQGQAYAMNGTTMKVVPWTPTVHDASEETLSQAFPPDFSTPDAIDTIYGER